MKSKDIRDKAIAMQEYARQAKDGQMIEWATDIRLRAERKAGQLLKEMAQSGERAVRGQAQKSQHETFQSKQLIDLGVTKIQSSRWQRLGAMAEAEFGARAVGVVSSEILPRTWPDKERISAISNGVGNCLNNPSQGVRAQRRQAGLSAIYQQPKKPHRRQMQGTERAKNVNVRMSLTGRDVGRAPHVRAFSLSKLSRAIRARVSAYRARSLVSAERAPFLNAFLLPLGAPPRAPCSDIPWTPYRRRLALQPAPL
jgi:hypothetical protein